MQGLCSSARCHLAKWMNQASLLLQKSPVQRPGAGQEEAAKGGSCSGVGSVAQTQWDPHNSARCDLQRHSPGPSYHVGKAVSRTKLCCKVRSDICNPFGLMQMFSEKWQSRRRRHGCVGCAAKFVPGSKAEPPGHRMPFLSNQRSILRHFAFCLRCRLAFCGCQKLKNGRGLEEDALVHPTKVEDILKNKLKYYLK